MKYITLHETTADFNAKKDNFELPHVAYVVETDSVDYNPLINVTSVSLNKSELSLAPNATETLVATVLPNDASNKAVTWSSSNQSVATVSSNGVVTAVGAGNATITVTTVDGGFTAQCSATISDPYNGHAYVDLGLPSGTKWATMNVGASSETDYGNYYKYGAGKKAYPSPLGGYYVGTTNPLPTSIDTARQVWAGQWHMPTSGQCQELLANTTYRWVTNYQGSGINGGTFTANGQTLFIPAAGSYQDETKQKRKNEGTAFYIWSSTPDTSNDENARIFRFESSTFSFVGMFSDKRVYGLSIRGVVG